MKTWSVYSLLIAPIIHNRYKYDCVVFRYQQCRSPPTTEAPHNNSTINHTWTLYSVIVVVNQFNHSTLNTNYLSFLTVKRAQHVSWICHWTIEAYNIFGYILPINYFVISSKIDLNINCFHNFHWNPRKSAILFYYITNTPFSASTLRNLRSYKVVHSRQSNNPNDSSTIIWFSSVIPEIIKTEYISTARQSHAVHYRFLCCCERCNPTHVFFVHCDRKLQLEWSTIVTCGECIVFSLCCVGLHYNNYVFGEWMIVLICSMTWTICINASVSRNPQTPTHATTRTHMRSNINNSTHEHTTHRWQRNKAADDGAQRTRESMWVSADSSFRYDERTKSRTFCAQHVGIVVHWPQNRCRRLRLPGILWCVW